MSKQIKSIRPSRPALPARGAQDVRVPTPAELTSVHARRKAELLARSALLQPRGVERVTVRPTASRTV